MTAPAAPTGGTSRSVMSPESVRVADMLRVLARGIRAHQLYMPNNPIYARAIEALGDALRDLWMHMERVELTVTEDQFLYDGVPVLEETARAADNLPWLFYKDGIRSFELRKGFETTDLVKFLDATQAARVRGVDDEDLVTLFWECDFAHFSYEYMEAGYDGTDAPGAELLQGGAPTGQTPVRPETEADSGVYGESPSPFARISDFDSTLYFLEDREIQYLQNSIREDFSGDLRSSVVAALFDTFESESEPTVREEICEVVETFLLTLLSKLRFRAAAYLLREAAAVAQRTPGITPSHRDRLTSLVSRMSAPEVVNQLLDTLEDVSLTPPQNDLAELLSHLDARALEPLLTHLVRTRNVELGALVDATAARLASSNTSELVSLITSADEALAREAISRAGALRTPAAVAPLARVLESRDADMRRAAVLALSDIATPGAMQAMEQSLEDEDRAIRIAAVQAIEARLHRPALPRVERAVQGPMLRDANSVERTAFFDAYVALAGDAAIPFMDGLLNPRGFLARKQDPAVRACAAVALGRLASPRAFEVLRRAATDKEIIVRTAASRALRGDM